MAANKTVIITVINKAYVEANNDEYPSMFDLFLEGFWVGEETRPLLRHLLVVSMDSTAHERCQFRRLNCYRLAAEGGGDGFAGEKIYMSNEFIEMMWKRTSFVLDVLKRGYNFIFTDTDVLWLRDPFKRLMNNQSIDLHISTDAYNGDPSSIKNHINTGFYFIKSSTKTTSFFQKWYDMRKNSTGMKEQDVLVKLVRQGVIRELDLNARFLDTLYFSGFCKDSHDVRLVVTVHANCCRSIRAKVTDLKAVLRDWKRFKDDESKGNIGVVGNTTNGFRWSRHLSCLNSWHKRNI
ncbi:Nucleotide-diphospho-sugar transferase family protein [Perilla frutescens var. frutescens]|nr:Nucleotide-diphospho-sugar transferase family protein [Perilla frutescens var. frutescens]